MVNDFFKQYVLLDKSLVRFANAKVVQKV